jgi:hypothetical protein
MDTANEPCDGMWPDTLPDRRYLTRVRQAADLWRVDFTPRGRQMGGTRGGGPGSGMIRRLGLR